MNSTRPDQEARRKAADGNPAVTLSTVDVDRLWSLAEASAHRNPEVAELLLAEIGRAHLLHPEDMPNDVVTMHSYVEYRDEGTGMTRQVRLVYPNEADIALAQVSILTLVGAALLGLTTGRSILWPKQNGQERRLTIIRVSSQPFPENA